MAEKSSSQTSPIQSSLAQIKKLEQDLKTQKEFWTGQEQYMRILVDATQAIQQSLLYAVTTLDTRHKRDVDALFADRFQKSLVAAGVNPKEYQDSFAEIKASIKTLADKVEKIDKALSSGDRVVSPGSQEKEGSRQQGAESCIEVSLAKTNDLLLRQEETLNQLNRLARAIFQAYVTGQGTEHPPEDTTPSETEKDVPKGTNIPLEIEQE